MKRISIVIPAYHEAAQIPATVKAIAEYIPQQYDYRLLFVDDGSQDDTWSVILEQKQQNPRVNGLRFSRNFGKEAALVAGLLEADGDAVITMDCDLQFPPRYLPEMLKLWEVGAEIVEGVKVERQEESPFHQWAARRFYSLFRKLSGYQLENHADFKLLDRKVVEVWRQLPEHTLFFRGQAAWVGFQHQSFPFEVGAREVGESRWSFRRLVNLTLDALTAFSTAPLRWISGIGGFLLLLAVIRFIIGLMRGSTDIAALRNLLVGLTGLILCCLGIVALYLENIVRESQHRPRYVISDRTPEDREDLAHDSSGIKAED